jgi:hypothetical protein
LKSLIEVWVWFGLFCFVLFCLNEESLKVKPLVFVIACVLGGYEL